MRAVAADEAERLVFGQVRRVLQSPEVAARAIFAAAGEGGDDSAAESEVMESLSRVDMVWDELFPAEQARILHLLVDRVDVASTGFHVRLRGGGLRNLIVELNQTPAEPAHAE